MLHRCLVTLFLVVTDFVSSAAGSSVQPIITGFLHVRDDQALQDANCSKVDCPRFMGLKPDAANISGATAVECCTDACIKHICSNGTVLVPNAVSVGGDTDAECCVPGCSAWTCTLPQVPLPSAARSPGNSDFECCMKVSCTLFTCPAGWILKVQDKDIVGNSTGACCDESCSFYTCPAGYPAILANQNFKASFGICCQIPVTESTSMTTTITSTPASTLFSATSSVSSLMSVYQHLVSLFR